MKQHLINTSQTLLAATLGLVALASINSTSHAQGSLTPPAGAPAPVMKSLDQIEARTPISAAPFTITKPGAYYLTGNLSVTTGNAITIATNNVSLDLNGFTIASTAPSATGAGILINANLESISIKNGFIRSGVTNNGAGAYAGPGFANGISSSYPYAQNVLVTSVCVSRCLYNGILLGVGNSTTIVNCQAKTVGSSGFYASTVTGSSAAECKGAAIVADEVSDSRGDSVEDNGIFASTVINCTGNSKSSTGIQAHNIANSEGTSDTNHGIIANTASNCSGISYGSGTGLFINYSASGCFGFSISGTGIVTAVANNCVGKRSGGLAIQASIGNGCMAAAGTNQIAYKYNMP